MTFGKVLSPQYFIWILPAWALVAARDRALAILGGFTLLLTQVEYPALYIRFVHMQPESVAIVVARNTLLVVTFAVAAWRLWSLSEAPASLFTDRSLQRPCLSEHNPLDSSASPTPKESFGRPDRDHLSLQRTLHHVQYVAARFQPGSRGHGR